MGTGMEIGLGVIIGTLLSGLLILLIKVVQSVWKVMDFEHRFQVKNDKIYRSLKVIENQYSILREETDDFLEHGKIVLETFRVIHDRLNELEKEDRKSGEGSNEG